MPNNHRHCICDFILTKGEREGQPCGAKCRPPPTTTQPYRCGRHSDKSMAKLREHHRVAKREGRRLIDSLQKTVASQQLAIDALNARIAFLENVKRPTV